MHVVYQPLTWYCSWQSKCYDSGAGTAEACDVTLIVEVESLDGKLKAALTEYMIDDSEISDKYEAPADMMHDNGALI